MRVFETAEVCVGVIGAEGELCTGRLGLLDERSAGDLVAIVDLDGDVVVDGGGDHLVATLGRPERFVSGRDLAREETWGWRRCRWARASRRDAIDVHVHEGLRVGDGADLLVDPEAHALAVDRR